MKALLCMFAVAVAACLFGIEAPSLPGATFPNAEVSTNFTFAAGAVANRRLVFTLELQASPRWLWVFRKVMEHQFAESVEHHTSEPRLRIIEPPLHPSCLLPLPPHAEPIRNRMIIQDDSLSSQRIGASELRHVFSTHTRPNNGIFARNVNWQRI